MPYMTARADEVEKALFLRRWGVPFEALAYVFGRDAKFWERQWLALGRPSLVGTTSKDPKHIPVHLVADEKHTRRCGENAYVATTVAEGCILGATVTTSADETQLTAAYGEFATEAKALDPEYRPQSVCLDGWSASQKAWKTLFPKVTLLLCFLHAVLKIVAAGLKRFGGLRGEVLNRAWDIYHAPNKGAFSQRVRRFQDWAQSTLSEGALKTAVRKLCRKRAEYAKAYDHPTGRRTSNRLDRLMDYQDRLLYGQRYFHGSLATAQQVVRSQALLWNFHPYGSRTCRKDPNRVSPFVDVNGFEYHENWLQNYLIASSMGGRQL